MVVGTSVMDGICVVGVGVSTALLGTAVVGTCVVGLPVVGTSVTDGICVVGVGDSLLGTAVVGTCVVGLPVMGSAVEGVLDVGAMVDGSPVATAVGVRAAHANSTNSLGTAPKPRGPLMYRLVFDPPTLVGPQARFQWQTSRR